MPSPAKRSDLSMKSRSSSDWYRSLYEAFGGQIELVAWPKSDPQMIHAGAYVLPAEMREELDCERQYLERHGRANEMQAVLAEPVDFAAATIVVHYRTIEYAAVRALRRRHAAPLVLSASAFPVCWERRCLYLQRRSPTADLGPSLLYGFAGAFQPAFGASGGSLVRTALRELEEETGLAAKLDASTPLAMFRDSSTASLELVLLGLGLNPEETDRLNHSAEGEIVIVPFDQLPKLLHHHDQWTKGGRFVVMSWLMQESRRLGSIAPIFEMQPHEILRSTS